METTTDLIAIEMIVPDPSLVILIGPSGSGKSTFARRHFRSTEVLSSDFCRALVCDDESNQAATEDAFELLHQILDTRLKRCRLTVVDATNVQASSRRRLEQIARNRGIGIVGVLFLLPDEICQARNSQRLHRQVLSSVIREQRAELDASLESLRAEGFWQIYTLTQAEQGDLVTVARRYVIRSEEPATDQYAQHAEPAECMPPPPAQE
jgi:protein phosphatase